MASPLTAELLVKRRTGLTPIAVNTAQGHGQPEDHSGRLDTTCKKYQYLSMVSYDYALLSDLKLSSYRCIHLDVILLSGFNFSRNESINLTIIFV